MSRRISLRALAFTQAMLLLATLLLPALAAAAVSTDQADYSPGSVVTISGDNSNGAGYLAGETVDVVVSGPNGYAASCAATADATGAWSCQVTLWNTVDAVGAYSYTATGQTSEVTESGTFTDASNITTTTTLTVGPPTTILPGTSVSLGGTLDWTPGTYNNGQQSKDGRTITINRYSASNCGGSATFVATATTGGGGASGQANYSATFSPTFTGTQYLQASFAGFSIGSGGTADNYKNSSSACIGLTVDNASTLALSISPASQPPSGTSATYTATLTKHLDSAAISGASVSIAGPWTNSNCTSGSPSTLTTAATNASGQVSVSGVAAPAVPGTYYYRASFAGNATWAAASSVCTPLVVDTAPSVSSTTPSDGDTGIASNASISLTFTEAVSVASGWYDIACDSGAHAAVVSGGPTTFSLAPAVPFTQGESCTVTIQASKVTDQDVNDPPDAMTADYSFSFTIDQAPSVTSTTPTDGATGVAPNGNLSITFSEPVHGLGSSGAFTIVCGSSGSHAAAVTGGPTTFTLNPAVDFAGGEQCTVTIAAASILDNDSADPPSSMLVDYGFSFTTLNPNLTTTTTASNASATYGDASVTLSATVAPNTVNVGTVAFTVKDGATTIGTAGPAGVTGGSASATFSLSGVTPGTYTILASYSGGSGFLASDNAGQSPAATLTFGRRMLTVTPDAQSVTYGDATPVTSFYTFKVTGFVLGEDASSADGYTAPSCSSPYAQGDHVAASPETISCSGGSADDYTFDTTAQANLTIDPKILVATFTVANKYFDNGTTATILTESATGQYGTDICTIAGGSTAFPSAAVGGPYTLTLTGWTLTGANCTYGGKADYVINSYPTTQASILAWSAAGHGFYAPIGASNSVFTAAPPANNPPTTPGGLPWNTAKGGSTIPLKFQVFAGTTELTDHSIPYPVSAFFATKMSSCGADATATSDPVDFTTTGGTMLRYDSTAHQWIQNWQTPKTNTDTCYRAWVQFADGSTLEAFFLLKK